MIAFTAPFPLEGGRVGDGGVERDVADRGHETTPQSPEPLGVVPASTPTQPSPLEGEGFLVL